MCWYLKGLKCLHVIHTYVHVVHHYCQLLISVLFSERENTVYLTIACVCLHQQISSLHYLSQYMPLELDSICSSNLHCGLCQYVFGSHWCKFSHYSTEKCTTETLPVFHSHQSKLDPEIRITTHRIWSTSITGKMLYTDSCHHLTHRLSSEIYTP